MKLIFWLGQETVTVIASVG